MYLWWILSFNFNNLKSSNIIEYNPQFFIYAIILCFLFVCFSERSKILMKNSVLEECPHQNASHARASSLCHCGKKASVVHTAYSMGFTVGLWTKTFCITIRSLLKIYEHSCFHGLKSEAQQKFLLSHICNYKCHFKTKPTNPVSSSDFNTRKCKNVTSLRPLTHCCEKHHRLVVLNVVLNLPRAAL